MDRPHYEKRYSSLFYRKENSPSENANRISKKSCCIPLCWVFLALLGLLAILFGMLFGLGVIGSLNK